MTQQQYLQQQQDGLDDVHDIMLGDDVIDSGETYEQAKSMKDKMYNYVGVVVVKRSISSKL